MNRKIRPRRMTRLSLPVSIAGAILVLPHAPSLAESPRKGPVVAIEIIHPGSGCTATPNVDISGDGSGAQAIAWLQPTTVESVEVLNGGRKHTPGINPADGAPYTQVFIQGHNSAPGSIIATPVIENGVITSVPKNHFSTTGGWVWTPVINVIDFTNAGEGAKIWAHLKPTGVQRIDVVGNGGSNYTNAKVTVSGKGCDGVVARAIVADAALLPPWWSFQNWFPDVHPVIGTQVNEGYFPSNLSAGVLSGTSPRGGDGHNVVWSKGSVELSARKFSVVSDVAPEVILRRTPHEDCNCYRAEDKILTLFTGYFGFANFVGNPQAPFPSRLNVYNNSVMVANFGQGLGIGGHRAGPGGLVAMGIQSHDPSESTNLSSGAIVTRGGLGVAKSTNIGGDLAVFQQAYRPGGGTWAGASDARLKLNIQPIKDPLVKISRLNPVTYDWKNPEAHGGVKASGGFIAQEVQQVFPEFIGSSKCVGKDCQVAMSPTVLTLSLPFAFDAHVVGSVKELASRARDLNKTSTGLRKRIATRELWARSVRLERLCLDSTCLDKTELNELLKGGR